MTAQKRCLIVDDDPLSRMALEQLVGQTNQLELVGSCAGPAEAAALLRKQKVDLMFLDVEMPEMTGIDFMKTMKHRPAIVLVTAKENYAVEAFEVEADDYLVKPVTLPRFMKALNRILDDQSGEGKGEKGEPVLDSLYVKVNTQLVKIPTADVLWIEALGDYVTIHTERENFIAHSTMKALEKKFPSDSFMRVHRSYIVQLNKIKAIEETVIIIGKKFIPIGDSYRAALLRRLNPI
jgi:DNA-binding LytR/AlgR family response regulator